jgi:hypothetical protein
VAIELTDRIQVAYRQAAPAERRLFNQAFFEWLRVDEEKVVSHRLAEPFGPEPPKDGPDADLSRLGVGWNSEKTKAANGALARALPAADRVGSTRTPGPFFRAGGSNVAALVRLRGVEPPRSFLHTDLNRARLPVPPQPRESAIYRLSGCSCSTCRAR